LSCWRHHLVNPAFSASRATLRKAKCGKISSATLQRHFFSAALKSRAGIEPLLCQLNNHSGRGATQRSLTVVRRSAGAPGSRRSGQGTQTQETMRGREHAQAGSGNARVGLLVACAGRVTRHLLSSLMRIWHGRRAVGRLTLNIVLSRSSIQQRVQVPATPHFFRTSQPLLLPAQSLKHPASTVLPSPTNPQDQGRKRPATTEFQRSVVPEHNNYRQANLSHTFPHTDSLFLSFCLHITW